MIAPITAAQQRALTEVGPGTGMGCLLRRFWVPALLTEELTVDEPGPVDVELLGERLVAFRDATGRVGLLDRQCPHRRTSLGFGRNEGDGLRCVYHGWKFAPDGQCLELPTEPGGSAFREKVRARAYPTRERGGIVWAYLGPPELEPAFPDFDWLDLPSSRLRIWKIEQECNFLQLIERDVDSAHISVLHRSLEPEDEIHTALRSTGGVTSQSSLAELDRGDTAPRIEVVRTDYGFCYAAIRTAGEGRYSIRVYPFVLPWHPVVPAFPAGYRVTHAFVPRTDTTSWHYLVVYGYEHDVDFAHYERTRGLELHGFRRLATRRNAYRRDPEAMRTISFSGIPGVIIQDHAIVELQGAIVDRTAECLVGTDRAIVELRSLLLEGIRAVDDGAPPPGVNCSVSGVEGASFVAPADGRWVDMAPGSLRLPRSVPT